MSNATHLEDQVLARLTVPAEAEYQAAVQALLRALASQHGLDARDVERLASVVEEICTNIIENAYPDSESGPLDLLLLRRPGQLAFAVEDSGLPFDFRTFEAEEHTSLGRMLTAAFPGEIRCLSRGRQGNRVELTCKLSARPMAHVATEEVALAAAPQAPEDTPLTLRLLLPGDAEGVVRCLYRSWGYTYSCDSMYDPAAIRELARTGIMQSCVAVNGGGEVVGHLALLLDGPRDKVPEVCRAVVDPRFRGHKLFERMKTFLRDHARAEGMLGMWSEAVTAHPYSQKGSLAVGARETGLLLGASPAASLKQLKEQQDQRESLMLLFLKVNEAPPREVFAPPAHQAMLQRIYSQLELARVVRPAGDLAGDLAEGSLVDVHVNPDRNIAFLQIQTVGRDLFDLVRFRLRELCLRRTDVIYIDLPLLEPAAMSYGLRLGALGFFFAGVIPEKARGDVLRLQYLNNVRVDPQEIQVASEFGKELLAYVVAARSAALGS